MDVNIIVLSGGCAIAFCVSILTGIFGVGGGFLMTPSLMIFLAIPSPVAVATGLATFLATSSIAMYKRRGTKTVDVKMALTISCGSIAGVLIGSRLLQCFSNLQPLTFGGKERDAADYILLWMFVILLGWIVFYMIYDHKKGKRDKDNRRFSLLQKLRIPPHTHFPSLDNNEFSVIVLLGMGIIIGCLTGLLGIGGGVVALPTLIYLIGQPPNKAVGTSLLMVWISSLTGVIYKGGAGDICIELWIAMMIGGLTGAVLGTHIGLKLSSEKLRMSFVYVVLAAMAIISWKIVVLTF